MMGWFYIFTIITFLLADVGGTPSQLGLPYGTHKHIPKTRLSDTVTTAVNLVDRLNDNIKKYKDCKAQYETASDGVSQCIKLLPIGLSAAEQQTVNGDTSISAYITQEQTYLEQNPVSAIASNITTDASLATNVAAIVDAAQTEVGLTSTSDIDRENRSKNQESQVLGPALGLGVALPPAQLPIPLYQYPGQENGYLVPQYGNLYAPGYPGQVWGYSTYSQYPPTGQASGYVSQYSTQTVPGFQYNIQGNHGGQADIMSHLNTAQNFVSQTQQGQGAVGGQFNAQLQIDPGFHYPPQIYAPLNSGQSDAAFLYQGQGGQFQGQSGYDFQNSAQNTGSQYQGQAGYSALNTGAQYQGQAGYSALNTGAQYQGQGGYSAQNTGAQYQGQGGYSAQNTGAQYQGQGGYSAQNIGSQFQGQADYSAQNTGAQYQGQGGYSVQNTGAQFQGLADYSTQNTGAQYQGQGGYSVQNTGAQFQGLADYSAQNTGAQYQGQAQNIGAQVGSSSQYSVQGAALNAQQLGLNSQNSAQGGFEGQYQSNTAFGQNPGINLSDQGQTASLTVFQYPGQVYQGSGHYGTDFSSQYGGAGSAVQQATQYGSSSASQNEGIGQGSQYAYQPGTGSAAQYGASSSSSQYGGVGSASHYISLPGTTTATQYVTSSSTQYGGGPTGSQFTGSGQFGGNGAAGQYASQSGGSSEGQYGASSISSQYGGDGGSAIKYGESGSGAQYGGGLYIPQNGGGTAAQYASSSSSSSQYGGSVGSGGQFAQGYQASGQSSPVVTQYTVQSVPVVTQYSLLADPMIKPAQAGYSYQYQQGGPIYASFSRDTDSAQQQQPLPARLR